MAKFTVIYNDEPFKTYRLDEPVVTIGRLPENTISIANMGVSRRHVRIEEDSEGNYMISDLNSLNGTYLNGKKISKAAPLRSGDKIVIGKYTIAYEEESAEVDADATRTSISTAAATGNSSDNKDEEFEIAMTPTKTATQWGGQIRTQQLANGKGNNPILIETGRHIVYELYKSNMSIGNSEKDDIFVVNMMVGKATAQVIIEKKKDGLYINAQKYKGKAKVNGQVIKSHLLKHKDRIEVGSSTFRYMENG